MASAELRPPQQGGGGRNQGNNNNANQFMLQRRMNEMINKEKPALVLTMTANGSDGTLFVSSGGQYTKTAETAPASVVLSSDDYLKIQRLIERGR
jgi:hypothetical protein